MLDRWKPKYVHLLHIILIIVIALLAYSNSFTGPFQFDDHNIIENNYFLRDFNYFAHPSQVKDTYLYYYIKVRYISLLSFAIDGLIYGFKPLGFHITNLVIHISTGLLIYWLLILTFATPPLKKSPLQERAPTIALVTALLFVAHPVQTQAVTYLVQRYMSLASFFYLLTLVLFIKWRLVSLEISRLGLEGFRSIQVGIYLLALASAILGMLTKEIVFTLPFAITLYEYLFFQGKWHKRIPLLIPFFLTLLVIPLGFTDMVDIHKPLSEIFHNLSRKTFIFTSVSRWDYLLTEFVVIVTYLRLLIFPVNQNLD